MENLNDLNISSNPETSQYKYIRTAMGIKSKSDFNSSSCFLPYEHVCQNLCDFLLGNSPTKEEEISLKNISDISLNKFSYLKNLYLDSDPTKCADELNYLKQFNCSLIVDATTKSNGQNTKNLREISKLSGIDICFGYTLKEDFYKSNLSFNFDKMLNEIRYELVYGYEDLIPSFLGEFIISECEIFPNKNEDSLFTMLFKVIEEFNIPIFIKLNKNSFSYEKNIFKYFEEKSSKINKKLLVFIYSNESPSQLDFNFIHTEILAKGFSFIYSTFECDLVETRRALEGTNLNKTKTTLDDSNIISTFFDNTKLKFITELILLENKKYISQIMISNNINFRVQLKKYGGFGYTNLFRHYFNKIANLCNLSEEEISKLYNLNLIDLLSWWEPPKKNIKKVKMITCSQ